MKAQVINAKAIKFTDTDNEEHTVLVSGIEELRIERFGKRLVYCIGLPDCPCLIEIDKGTYNIFFESIEKCLGNATENTEIETERDISKKIKFDDLGGWQQTVLPENIEGLSVEQYDGKLEYYVNISNKGYSTKVDFKTFNILLVALKAVAHVKEQANEKNLIEFDNANGVGCAINLDDFDYAAITQIKTSDIYTVDIWDAQDALIGNYIVTVDVAQKLGKAFEKTRKERGATKNDK